MKWQGRDIFAAAHWFVALALWELIANVLSLAFLLLMIVYIAAAAWATVRSPGAGWLLLTMPAGVLIAVPIMRWLAQFSERAE